MRAIRFVFGVLVQWDRRYQTLLTPDPIDAAISSNLPNPGRKFGPAIGIKCTDGRMDSKQNIGRQLFSILVATVETSGEI